MNIYRRIVEEVEGRVNNRMSALETRLVKRVNTQMEIIEARLERTRTRLNAIEARALRLERKESDGWIPRDRNKRKAMIHERMSRGG